MVRRIIEDWIFPRLYKGKLLLITGPRQVGKTTLLSRIVSKIDEKHLWLNCDNPDDRSDLEDATVTSLKNLVGNYSVLVIDEAQRVKNIGLTLKLLVDNIPQVQVLASGSSALELANEIKEPLTGRKREMHLFPLSTEELTLATSLREEKRMLDHRLLYGFYPEVVTNLPDAVEALNELTESYLYKDLLALDTIRKPVILQKLLVVLALQVGGEVSYLDLGNTIGIDKETAEKYIDLLEKCFVIFRLNSFSRNMRKEVKKGKKIYFWDNGIRNGILNNFTSIPHRSDVGALWENFIISERLKYLNYHRISGTTYFWRTSTGQELDWIEERDGKIMAYETKWNSKRKKKLPASFQEAYPDSEYFLVNRENYMDFISARS